MFHFLKIKICINIRDYKKKFGYSELPVKDGKELFLCMNLVKSPLFGMSHVIFDIAPASLFVRTACLLSE